MADDEPILDDEIPVLEPKPGWKSTEFYVTLIAQALAIIVALGLISSEQVESIAKTIGAAVAAIVAIVGSMNYTTNRTKLKE